MARTLHEHSYLASTSCGHSPLAATSRDHFPLCVGILTLCPPHVTSFPPHIGIFTSHPSCMTVCHLVSAFSPSVTIFHLAFTFSPCLTSFPPYIGNLTLHWSCVTISYLVWAFSPHIHLMWPFPTSHMRWKTYHMRWTWDEYAHTKWEMVTWGGRKVGITMRGDFAKVYKGNFWKSSSFALWPSQR